jgi:hypothetical protein
MVPFTLQDLMAISNSSLLPGSCGIMWKHDTGQAFETKTLSPVDEKFVIHKNAKVYGFVRLVKLAISNSTSLLSHQIIAVDYPTGGPLFGPAQKGCPSSFDDMAKRFYIAEIILVLEDLLDCESRGLYIHNDNFVLDGLGHVTFRDFNISPASKSSGLGKRLGFYTKIQLHRFHHCMS